MPLRCPSTTQEATIDWSTVDFSKSHIRKLARQRKWSLLVCSRLSMPLLLAAAYFIGMYLIGVASTASMANNSVYSYKLQQRKVRLGDTVPARGAFV